MIRILELHIQKKKQPIPGKLAHDCVPGYSNKKIQFLFVLALANYLRGKKKNNTAKWPLHTNKAIFNSKQ